MTILQTLAKVGPYPLGRMAFAIFQHLCFCLARLRNEGRAQLDSVRSLADCVHHECVGTDSELLCSLGCALFEFIGELE